MSNSINSFAQTFVYSLIISLFSGAIAYGQSRPPANRMDYHFSWDGQSTVLKMDIVYDNHGNDSTTFIYGVPIAGGQTDIFSILGKVKADRGDLIKIIAATRTIIVKHTKPGMSTLHAEIDGKLVTNSRVLPNEAFRPTLEPGFLYTKGFHIFMEVPDAQYNQIGMVWDNYPKDFPYLVSTDPEAKPGDLQVISSEESQRFAVLLQMNKDLRINKRKISGINHYIVTSKSDSTSDLPKRIPVFIDQYIPTIRNFWNDYDAPFYILNAMPLRNRVKDLITGMGMPNGLSIRYEGDLNKKKVPVIAHEISHNWIGVNLRLETKNGMDDWFNEGFNDYIALYNLVRSGLYDSEAFLNYLNKETLAAHYSSPVSRMPADSILKNFFKDHNYEKLPYQRGFIYAFYLDNQIRLASKNKKNIRDFLLKLYHDNKKTGLNPFSTVEFAKALAAFLPVRDTESEITRYMLKGELIKFDQNHLATFFLVAYKGEIPVIRLRKGANLCKLFQ